MVLFARGAEVITREQPKLETFFTAQNVTGTFVLYDLKTNTRQVFNPQRAATRFIPASTFKIPNTIIGLDAGAVKNVDEVLPYGGKPQWLKEWEHDMPLREALKLSAVPIYQELARRIGLPRMAEKVKAFDYGNAEIGTVVDQFWLQGPLKISALEQVDFLSRLVQGKLPAKPEAIAGVKEITLRETSEGRELHYKTGWSGSSIKPQVGWLVGWVHGPKGDSTFALNIEMTAMEQAPKRLVVAKGCLKQFGKFE
ncbi:MAG: Beta-lactamase [Verrucomicrobiaceae bacterium]|nr:Beta-lactamase [Verrucomicrobiaceae bacterium]